MVSRLTSEAESKVVTRRHSFAALKFIIEVKLMHR